MATKLTSSIKKAEKLREKERASTVKVQDIGTNTKIVMSFRKVTKCRSQRTDKQ